MSEGRNDQHQYVRIAGKIVFNGGGLSSTARYMTFEKTGDCHTARGSVFTRRLSRNSSIQCA